MRTVVVVFILASLFSFLQTSPTFPDPDSFYHAKMALLTRDQGILHQFPWLQATVLKDTYVNHHFLYHVFLIPFVTFFNPLTGIKFATVVFGAGATTILYLLLRILKIRYAWAWLLVLGATTPFIYRLSLAKTPGVSVLFLLLGFWLMVKSTAPRSRAQSIILHLAFFILNFLYVWLYSAWPFLFVLTVIHVLVTRYVSGSRQYGLLSTSIFGILAGLIFNPYFPENFQFAWWQIAEIGLGITASGAGSVIEWLPYTPGALFVLAFPLTILWCVSIGLFVAYVVRVKDQKATYLASDRGRVIVWCTTLIMTVLLTLGTLKARRNIEYLAPFMVLSSALGCTLWGRIAQFKLRTLSLGVMTALWALLVASVVTTVRNFTGTLHQFQSGIVPASFASVAAWLRENTPAGSVVLLPSWDRFPMFFYYNTHNYYLDGLHPRFTDLKTPGGAARLADLRRDILPNSLAALKEFNVSYVVTNALRERFHDVLQDDDGAERVYQDSTHTVYQMLY